MTLFQLLTSELNRQERKHDLECDHAKKTINRMTNSELLEFVSDQLEYAGHTFEDKS
jgi:hypothetical protein